MKNKLLTLTFPNRGNEYLLGLKKRGFGAGKWNGFGGKVEANESIIEAAKRELFEESGLSAVSLQQHSVTVFEFENVVPKLEVHIFLCTDFKNEPRESDEMSPKWYDIADIPYANMWVDDQYWFGKLHNREYWNAYFKFTESGEQIISYNFYPFNLNQNESIL